jgi:hypothetical protein
VTARKDIGTQAEQDARTMRLIRGRCDEVGDCWLWNGATGGRSDLPCIHHNGKTKYVHRVVYDLSHARGAGKLVVTPKCTNRLCVSPKCLEALPRKLALQRAGQRGSYSRPSKVLATARSKRANSRYSDELIAEVRQSTAGPKQIARETGMSESYIKSIRNGTARRDYASPFAGLFTGLMAEANQPRSGA